MSNKKCLFDKIYALVSYLIDNIRINSLWALVWLEYLISLPIILIKQEN